MSFPSTGGTTSSLTKAIFQTAHSFTEVGAPVYINSSGVYVLADNDSQATSDVVGLVSSIVDANNFTLAVSGYLTGITPAVISSGVPTAGDALFVNSVAGKLTATEPSSISQTRKPIIIMDSATSGWVIDRTGTPTVSNTAVVQYGSGTITMADGTSLTTTAADIGTIDLPAAGTYVVSYEAFVGGQSVGTQHTNFWISNLSNTELTGSRGAVAGTDGGANAVGGCSGQVNVTVTAAGQLKLRAESSSGTSTFNSNATDGITQFRYLQIGASPVPMDLVGEYGENTGMTNGQTFTSSAYTDITNGSFTLPTAGTWEVGYVLAFEGNTISNGYNAVITDTSNNQVAFSNAVSNLSNVTYGVQLAQRVIITTTGAATYKLRFATTGGIATLINASTPTSGAQDGASKVYWTKISGFLPSSGQTVDYIEAGQSANQTSLTGTSDIIWSSVKSGNIPLNTTTGVFTLTAGKTYDMTAVVRVLAGAAGNYLAFEWVDAVTNTALTGGNIGQALPMTFASTDSPQPTAHIIYTPSSNQTVKVRANAGLSSGTITNTVATLSYASIKQLGTSSAITNYGLTVDYGQYHLSASSTPGASADITGFVTDSGTIPCDGTSFSLTAGKTYEITSNMSYTGIGASENATYSWVDSTNANIVPGSNQGSYITGAGSLTTTDKGSVTFIYTPTSDVSIKIRSSSGNNTTYQGGTTFTNNAASTVTIKQLGTSVPSITATVNDQTTSGYFDIGTMRIQWGRELSTSDTGQTVSFPVAFASTPSLTVSMDLGTAASTIAEKGAFSAVSTTSFSYDRDDAIANADNAYINWQAIGLHP